MKKYIVELLYTPEKYDTLEEYFRKSDYKVFNPKTDCLIFFNVGAGAKELLSSGLNEYAIDTVTAYTFIKDIESRFNVNINVFDIEYLFTYNMNRNQFASVKITDLTQVYLNLTNEYRRNLLNFLLEKK